MLSCPLHVYVKIIKYKQNKVSCQWEKKKEYMIYLCTAGFLGEKKIEREREREERLIAFLLTCKVRGGH